MSQSSSGFRFERDLPSVAPLAPRVQYAALRTERRANMKPWISLAEGLKLAGLRLAVARASMPSPWSELCRGLFHVKGLDYQQLDARDPVTGLALLKSTTAQESVPVAFWNDERPRAYWLEQISLAER